MSSETNINAPTSSQTQIGPPPTSIDNTSSNTAVSPPPSTTNVTVNPPSDTPNSNVITPPPSDIQNAPKIIKEGWLWKKGNSTIKNWMKRYFVLSNESLTYYEDIHKKKKKGTVMLKDVTGVGPVEHSKKNFCYALKRDKGLFVMQCANDEERNEWISVFKQLQIADLEKDVKITKSSFGKFLEKMNNLGNVKTGKTEGAKNKASSTVSNNTTNVTQGNQTDIPSPESGTQVSTPTITSTTGDIAPPPQSTHGDTTTSTTTGVISPPPQTTTGDIAPPPQQSITGDIVPPPQTTTGDIAPPPQSTQDTTTSTTGDIAPPPQTTTGDIAPPPQTTQDTTTSTGINLPTSDGSTIQPPSTNDAFPSTETSTTINPPSSDVSTNQPQQETSNISPASVDEQLNLEGLDIPPMDPHMTINLGEDINIDDIVATPFEFDINDDGIDTTTKDA